MAVLDTGLNTVIKQVVSGVSTPFYPITAAGNVIDAEGNDLETRLSGIDTTVGGISSDLSTFINTTAPATYLNVNLKGANSGLAELDATGKVPSSQLPSYVDDVIEIAAMKADFTEAYFDIEKTQVVTPESGKVYILTSDNSTYRWSGSVYAAIRGDLVLGETDTTAYRGDRGKTAYDHSQAAHARVDATKVEASETNGNIQVDGSEVTVYVHPGSGTNPHGTTKTDVGLGNVGNFLAVSTESGQSLTSEQKAAAAANMGVANGATAVTASAQFNTGVQVATVTSTDAAGSATTTNVYVPEAVAADAEHSISAQSGLMTGAEKAKLAGISAEANKIEVNQIISAGTKIAEVVVDGDTTNKIELFASTASASAEFSTGTKIASVTADGTATDIYVPAATDAQAGTMSATDKDKLDDISTEANKTTVSAQFATGTKIATVGIDGTDTDVYVPAATTSADGTMSAADKAKIDNCMQAEIVHIGGTPTITDGIVFQIVS